MLSTKAEMGKETCSKKGEGTSFLETISIFVRKKEVQKTRILWVINCRMDESHFFKLHQLFVTLTIPSFQRFDQSFTSEVNFSLYCLRPFGVMHGKKKNNLSSIKLKSVSPELPTALVPV